MNKPIPKPRESRLPLFGHGLTSPMAIPPGGHYELDITPHVITNVYVFTNGMAMVFDERGEQMPQYQGRWEEVRERVMRDKPAGVEVEHGLSWR